MKKKSISLVLCLVLLLCAALPAAAEETEGTVSAYPEEGVEVISDEVDDWGRRTTITRLDGYFSTFAARSYGTVADAAVYLREQMKAREAEISFVYTGSYASIKTLVEDIFHAAIAHTGVPTEGDYLAWNWGGYDATYASSSGSVDLVYSMTYYTTAEQEEQLSGAVSSLLSELNLTGLTDVQKIQTIYQYICANVDYDNANLNNNDYTLKFSAYAALVNGTAVCQGYATLLYRLLLTENIDCRVIVGKSSGTNHAWNIIKLCAWYYNADATWDASYDGDSASYRWLLKGSDNFTGHTPRMDKSVAVDYTSAAFQAAYPIAASDAEEPVHSFTYAITTAPTASTAGTLTGTCSQCGATTTITMPKLDTEHYTFTLAEATCAAAGAEVYTWNETAYGEQTVTRTLDMLAHSWDAGEITTAAGCTASGVKTYTCTACGATKTETIAATGHSYVSGVCTVCGEEVTVAVTRLYNPATGEHLLSTSDAEMNTLTDGGWTVDGVMCYMPMSGTPIYRLYNPVSGEHLYTMVQTEIDTLTASGWAVDGVMAYSADEGGTPIYRLYNAAVPAISSHLLSTSLMEMNTLTAQGWTIEGVALLAAK